MSKDNRIMKGIEYSSNQKGVAYVDKSGVAAPTKKVLKVPSTKNDETDKSQHIKNDVSVVGRMSTKELIKRFVR